ncbi:MAG: type 1 glutamine amidotransferase [Actinomycetota bacterium]|nr:type 1 glutamine amidotransferase [Actinomycetota bacterium]
MRSVAVIQHEPSVPPGSITEVLEQHDIEHFVLEAWREQSWPTPGDLSGLVVLGGTMNVDELDRYPFLKKSRDLMAGAIESGIPTLGVCLGSQMMARVLGAEVFRASPRNALFSRVVVTEPDDPIVAAFASDTPVLQFHEDTFTVPPDAVPLATSAASGLAQAFRYGDSAYAIQFHFEVDRPIIEQWCQDIGDDSLVAEWGTSTDQLLGGADRYAEPAYDAGKKLMARFLALKTAAVR